MNLGVEVLYYIYISVPTFLILLYLYTSLYIGRCKSNTCLVGKTAIVTGGNSGLGFRVALDLAGRGCKIIIADITDGKQVVQTIKDWTGNPNITYKYINLGSFETIRKFAQEINESEEYLHLLINNAGCGEFTPTKTADGCSLGMQVNHFGSFLLTHLLINLLKKSAPSRIVFTSSWMAFLNNLTVENLNDPKYLYIYSNSKVCNIISSDGFAKKLKGTGVTSNAVHPGLVKTPIFGKVNNKMGDNILRNFFMDLFYHTWIRIYGKTAEQGAQTILNCALSKRLENVSGKFFSDCKPFFRPMITRDPVFCAKIWDLSEKFVNLKPEEKLS